MARNAGIVLTVVVKRKLSLKKLFISVSLLKAEVVPFDLDYSWLLP